MATPPGNNTLNKFTIYIIEFHSHLLINVLSKNSVCVIGANVSK
jgi:hypothetical protein